MTTVRAIVLTALTAVTLQGASAQVAAEADALVLTGGQANYSLASALLHGTPIRVENVPADGRPISLMKDYIARRMDTLGPIFAAATAVISLTNALPGDPIYRFAREANIRIVGIDAAVPWSLSSPGVALTDTPVSNIEWGSDPDTPDSIIAPYFWLSVSNAIRMGDIIAHDLTDIFPAAGPTIAENLDRLKRDLLTLRNEYQNRLIEISDDTVFALTGDFVYLTNDMGLYVDGYFIKQDIRWSDADRAGLTRHLKDHGIKVVLHKWVPSEPIQTAIADAGAELVVLDTGDPGRVADRKLLTDGLQQILKDNLDAVFTALGR